MSGLHVPVPLEAEPEEEVILQQHLGAGTGKVQGKGGYVPAQVADLEHQVLGQPVLAVAIGVPVLLRKRDEARLHIPVIAELFPAHLHGGTEHQIRSVRQFPRRLPKMLPAPLERQTAEHACLG